MMISSVIDGVKNDLLVALPEPVRFKSTFGCVVIVPAVAGAVVRDCAAAIKVLEEETLEEETLEEETLLLVTPMPMALPITNRAIAKASITAFKAQLQWRGTFWHHISLGVDSQS